jgi:ribosomal protein L16 Arg81 hydroxylase
MTKKTLQVKGFNEDQSFNRTPAGMLLIELVLTRKLSRAEEIRAKDHGLEFAAGITYTLSVTTTDEIQAAIEKVNENLASLEAAALANAERERAAQEKAKQEVQAEQSEIRDALESAGISPVNPKLGHRSRDW